MEGERDRKLTRIAAIWWSSLFTCCKYEKQVCCARSTRWIFIFSHYFFSKCIKMALVFSFSFSRNVWRWSDAKFTHINNSNVLFLQQKKKAIGQKITHQDFCSKIIILQKRFISPFPFSLCFTFEAQKKKIEGFYQRFWLGWLWFFLGMI